MIGSHGPRSLAVVLATGLLGMCLAAPASAQAGDWLFRPSYFQNGRDFARQSRRRPPVRSRSAYRRPLVPGHYGHGARGIYRRNRIFLRSGNSVDTTIIYEDWFEHRP